MSVYEESQYVATWKYTPPEAQEYSEVQRGQLIIDSTSVACAFAEAKKAVCREHPDWDTNRVEIVTIQEPFL